MLIRVLLASGTAAVASVIAAASPVGATPACGPTNGSFDGGGWLACAATSDVNPTIPIAGTTPQDPQSVAPQSRQAPPAVSPAAQTKCTASNTDTVDGTAPPAPRAGIGRWMFVYCGDAGNPGGWSWIAAGAAAAVFASPAQLARQAYARLTPPIGVPDYNPRHRAGQADGTVVGFTTWLWLDGQSLAARSVTASAGPNSATVTARPSSVSFDPGDGSPAVVCAGGGVAYDPAQPNTVSDCVHRYVRASGQTPGGVFVLTAQVTWTATWTGTKGAGGVLPALTVMASTLVRVDELQAVNE